MSTASVCNRLGDHAPQDGSKFWQEVRKKGEGCILILLKDEASGLPFLAGASFLIEA